MTPDEFTLALQTVGWSQRQLAAMLECDLNIPLRWSKGTAQIPRTIERWLTKLVACHERLPVPTDWRVR